MATGTELKEKGDPNSAANHSVRILTTFPRLTKQQLCSRGRAEALTSSHFKLGIRERNGSDKGPDKRAASVTENNLAS